MIVGGILIDIMYEMNRELPSHGKIICREQETLQQGFILIRNAWKACGRIQTYMVI
jgi:hypothetical protein